jgi:hypothetical protein
MKNLIDHCKKELQLAGYYDGDQYDAQIAQDVLALAEVFSNQQHSGFSAEAVLFTFNKVINWENLSPLTSDPEEWVDVGDMMGKPCWQSSRNPRVFSDDGGKTWYKVQIS